MLHEAEARKEKPKQKTIAKLKHFRIWILNSLFGLKDRRGRRGVAAAVATAAASRTPMPDEAEFWEDKPTQDFADSGRRLEAPGSTRG